MRKIGPILAILSGFVTLVLAVLGLLVAQGVLKELGFIGDFQNEATKTIISTTKTTVTTMYIIMIVTGLLQFTLGIYALKKPGGFAAFILLVLFVATTTLSVISGIKAATWPGSATFSIVINGLASIGLLTGFIKEKE